MQASVNTLTYREEVGRVRPGEPRLPQTWNYALPSSRGSPGRIRPTVALAISPSDG
jgi:hypothetical protein